MAISKDVQEARHLTMEALNLQPEDVEYITAELLAEYEESGVDEEEPFLDENGAEPAQGLITCRPLDYGTSLMFTSGGVWYRNHGTPGSGYACSMLVIHRWISRQGDEFTPLGRCSSGRYYYRLCRPSP